MNDVSDRNAPPAVSQERYPLREARLEKGMTQEQLSRQLRERLGTGANVSISWISRIERGQGGLDVKTALAWAEALQMEPSALACCIGASRANSKVLDGHCQ